MELAGTVRESGRHYPRFIRELWDGDTINYLDVQRQTDFSCMSLPYGTATLKIDNSDKRFDPNDKKQPFQVS